MKYLLTINGQEHTLEMIQGKVLSCQFGGVAFEAEVAEVAPGLISLLIGGKSFSARITADAETADGAARDSIPYSVQVDGTTYAIALSDPRRWTRTGGAEAREGRQQITAPMAGKVVRILVSEGQRVEPGQGLIVVEAMKMQNEIKSRAPGTVEKILVRGGQAVNAGEPLLVVE